MLGDSDRPADTVDLIFRFDHPRVFGGQYTIDHLKSCRLQCLGDAGIDVFDGHPPIVGTDLFKVIDHITRQFLCITLKLCCTIEVGNRPGLAEFIRHRGGIQGSMDDYRAINRHKQVGRGDV